MVLKLTEDIIDEVINYNLFDIIDNLVAPKADLVNVTVHRLKTTSQAPFINGIEVTKDYDITYDKFGRIASRRTRYASDDASNIITNHYKDDSSTVPFMTTDSSGNKFEYYYDDNMNLIKSEIQSNIIGDEVLSAVITTTYNDNNQILAKIGKRDISTIGRGADQKEIYLEENYQYDEQNRLIYSESICGKTDMTTSKTYKEISYEMLDETTNLQLTTVIHWFGVGESIKINKNDGYKTLIVTENDIISSITTYRPDNDESYIAKISFDMYEYNDELHVTAITSEYPYQNCTSQVKLQYNDGEVAHALIMTYDYYNDMEILYAGDIDVIYDYDCEELGYSTRCTIEFTGQDYESNTSISEVTTYTWKGEC